jgi:hypothetical protein
MKDLEDKIEESQEAVEENASKDRNPDPITGEAGAHPIGVATGGAGGAVTGAAIGAALGGPVGAAIGGAVGAVAGGLAGKGAAEAVNPTEEEGYWRGRFEKLPYYKSGLQFDQYQPAFRYGWEAASRPEFRNRRFEDIEGQLATEWPNYESAGSKSADWSEVRLAARDAYDRIRERIHTHDDE